MSINMHRVHNNSLERMRSNKLNIHFARSSRGKYWQNLEAPQMSGMVRRFVDSLIIVNKLSVENLR